MFVEVMAQSVVKNDLPAQQLHRVKEQTLGTWENMGKHGSTSPSRDVKNFFGNRWAKTGSPVYRSWDTSPVADRLGRMEP